MLKPNNAMDFYLFTKKKKKKKKKCNGFVQFKHPKK